MRYLARISRERVNRCLLCAEAVCGRACPRGIPVDRIMRALRFENPAGAMERLPEGFNCEGCAAPCEDACLQRPAVEIREVLGELAAAKTAEEKVPEGKPDLTATLCGVELENPFLLSSSVVSGSYDKLARAFDMGWAGAAYKTICDFIPHETSPRYAITGEKSAAYGLKNIEQLSLNTLDEDLEIIRKLKERYPKKRIIASIMGRNEEEWTRLAGLCRQAGADAIECNFSCPNMEKPGLGSEIGQDEDAVGRMTAAARKGFAGPLLVKLTPNVTSMIPFGRVARANGADGISAINTVKSILGMNIDTFSTSPSVRGLSGVGGYSGKAVMPLAQRFVWELCADPEPGLPVSGMGGIETWKDALTFMLLGAENVQVTTAVMIYGLRIIDDLKEGLELYLREKGIPRVRDLVGMGIESVRPLSDLDRGSVLYPKFEREKCVGCGRCVLSCRDGGHEALRMHDGKPVMDPGKCVGCHLCVLVCPREAIRPGKKRVDVETG